MAEVAKAGDENAVGFLERAAILPRILISSFGDSSIRPMVFIAEIRGATVEWDDDGFTPLFAGWKSPVGHRRKK